MMYPEYMNADDIAAFEDEYEQWRAEQDEIQALREEEELARAERDFLDQEEYILDNDHASRYEAWEDSYA